MPLRHEVPHLFSLAPHFAVKAERLQSPFEAPRPVRRCVPRIFTALTPDYIIILGRRCSPMRAISNLFLRYVAPVLVGYVLTSAFA